MTKKTIEQPLKSKTNIFLVPHSHWDREWYFSYDTANVLLHHNFADFIQFNKKKWFLDGQLSLVDDILKWNKKHEKLIIKKLQAKNLASGPLYSQPDVFNSQAETIIRNFEMGKKISNTLKIPYLETAYLPDTFGFGENLPQIFKHCGIKNFVFWRGLPQKQLASNDFFYWEGLDGTKIKSFVLRDGYYSLGMYYPYNQGKISPLKNDPNYFLSKIEKRLQKIVGNHQKYILPLGGDQAPYLFTQDDFIKKLNAISKKYQFILVSNYDKFFDNKKITDVFQGSLRMPITGKIHRTITSSRYDIKKAFRQAEDSLYYLLEPLEFFYQNYANNYDFEKYKEENIIKPLLIAQTHDSLGACNTDSTNAFQLQRILRIQENIDSQVDLLIKKLLQEKNIQDHTLAIFNPAPFVNDYYRVITIYLDNKNSLNINEDNLKIKTLSVENISLDKTKPLYKTQIAIIAKQLLPLSLNEFSLAKQKQIASKKISNLELINNGMAINLGKEKIVISLSGITDQGDSYDFSPGKKIILKISDLQGHQTDFDQETFYELSFKINDSLTTLYLFKNSQKLTIQGQIDNKFSNSRLELNVDLVTKEKVNIAKSLNLAISKFSEKDNSINWKEKMSEYPTHVDVNDGIISLNNKIHILTKGTNEIYQRKYGVKLILYRTYQNVTKNNLVWRPSTSGLSWKEDSPDAQLNKNLFFDLVITSEKRVKALNQFKFSPYAYYLQQRNFIANKMTKFVINNILDKPQKLITLKVDDPNIFISSLSFQNKILTLRLANMENQLQPITYWLNNQKQKVILRKYEIKKICHNMERENDEK